MSSVVSDNIYNVVSILYCLYCDHYYQIKRRMCAVKVLFSLTSHFVSKCKFSLNLNKMQSLIPRTTIPFSTSTNGLSSSIFTFLFNLSRIYYRRCQDILEIDIITILSPFLDSPVNNKNPDAWLMTFNVFMKTTFHTTSLWLGEFLEKGVICLKDTGVAHVLSNPSCKQRHHVVSTRIKMF